MKIWVLSDTHIGFKNGNREWFGIFEDCYNKFILPLFEEKVSPGDILVHCGDVFEERQSVNLYAITTAVKVFETLDTMFSSIHIICGNHDVQNDRNNDITSLDSLRYIGHISVYREPAKIEAGGKTVSLIPWEKDNGKFLESLSAHAGSDYVFCHADILGATMNASKVKSDKGVDISGLKNARNIYSGHIHYRHRYNNVTFVGSPYSMTFNDVDNAKGVYSIDVETGEVEFHENTVSPGFRRFSYAELSGKKTDEINAALSNNFVELVVNPGEPDTKKYHNFRREADLNGGARDIQVKYDGVIDDAAINMEDSGISDTMSLEEMAYAYVDNVLECDGETRKNVRTIISRLFKK